ncbi:hypothetical protein P152DRAFT_37793 [Eremomyces bilateralis CBS 781.70]|uniref:Uncharacterized protein n=1 Tax=Eremomyces bilateralis CBS 781.70 TaxID=1392243 RepID=A0A6G1G1N4_9PEZI|nr:uncharacterized protein P152DRAFT_37793 [Eremomyces bilateralis CBS 781.70]KAF1811928.1 hypothetical protein P152DRAFT_37793 [Eremomyces bilateralis CBS 781.70]
MLRLSSRQAVVCLSSDWPTETPPSPDFLVTYRSNNNLIIKHVKFLEEGLVHQFGELDRSKFGILGTKGGNSVLMSMRLSMYVRSGPQYMQEVRFCCTTERTGKATVTSLESHRAVGRLAFLSVTQARGGLSDFVGRIPMHPMQPLLNPWHNASNYMVTLPTLVLSMESRPFPPLHLARILCDSKEYAVLCIQA